MNGRLRVLRGRFHALPDEGARLQDGIGELDSLYRDLIRAYAPSNVQYERERVIARISNPREIAFVLGFLSEGENEAALLLELICGVLVKEPRAEVGHLVDEAWYYLRTSIDASWQLDDGPPCASAALMYLVLICEERLGLLRALPATMPMAGRNVPARAAQLRGLRTELCG